MTKEIYCGIVSVEIKTIMTSSIAKQCPKCGKDMLSREDKLGDEIKLSVVTGWKYSKKFKRSYPVREKYYLLKKLDCITHRCEDCKYTKIENVNDDTGRYIPGQYIKPLHKSFIGTLH